MPLIQAAQSVRVLGAGSLAHWEKSIIEARGATGGVAVGVGATGNGVGSWGGFSVGFGLGGSVASTGSGSGGSTGAVAVGGIVTTSVGALLPLPISPLVGVGSTGGASSSESVGGYCS